MTKPIRILGYALTAIAAATIVSAQQAGTVTAIKAARLFDGTSDSTIPDAVVLVQGSRITATGSRLPVPAGAQIVDLASGGAPPRMRTAPKAPRSRSAPALTPSSTDRFWTMRRSD